MISDKHNGISTCNYIQHVDEQIKVLPRYIEAEHKHWKYDFDGGQPIDVNLRMQPPQIDTIINCGICGTDGQIKYKENKITMILMPNT